MTESSVNSAGPKTVSIKHVRSTGYSTEFITGMSVAGPLSDGMFRVTYFRDALPTVDEIFEQIDDSKPGEIDPKRRLPSASSLVREDVVTFVMSPKLVRRIGLSLVRSAQEHGVEGPDLGDTSKPDPA